MICENDLCIYSEQQKCTLNKIAINQFGMCDCCICISLEKSDLQRKKKQILDSFLEKE